MDRPTILVAGTRVTWEMGGERTIHRMATHIDAIAKGAELEQAWDDRVAAERELEARYVAEGVDVVRSFEPPPEPAPAPVVADPVVLPTPPVNDNHAPFEVAVMAEHAPPLPPIRVGDTTSTVVEDNSIIDPGMVAMPASQPVPPPRPSQIPPQRPADRAPESEPVVEPPEPVEPAGAPPLLPVMASCTYDSDRGKAVIELAPNRDVTLWRSVAGTKSTFDLKAADGAKTRNWGAKPGDVVTIRVDDKDGLLILDHQIPSDTPDDGV